LLLTRLLHEFITL